MDIKSSSPSIPRPLRSAPQGETRAPPPAAPGAAFTPYEAPSRLAPAEPTIFGTISKANWEIALTGLGLFADRQAALLRLYGITSGGSNPFTLAAPRPTTPGAPLARVGAALGHGAEFASLSSTFGANRGLESTDIIGRFFATGAACFNYSARLMDGELKGADRYVALTEPVLLTASLFFWAFHHSVVAQVLAKAADGANIATAVFERSRETVAAPYLGVATFNGAPIPNVYGGVLPYPRPDLSASPAAPPAAPDSRTG